MVTTIQISEDVKEELRVLKIKRNDSFEDVIVKLIHKAGVKKMSQRELLKQGYVEMNKDLTELNKDWNSINEGWD